MKLTLFRTTSIMAIVIALVSLGITLMLYFTFGHKKAPERDIYGRVIEKQVWVSKTILTPMDTNIAFPHGWIVIKVSQDRAFDTKDLEKALKTNDWHQETSQGIIIMRQPAMDSLEVHTFPYEPYIAQAIK